jgi:hypothetical protein
MKAIFAAAALAASWAAHAATTTEPRIVIDLEYWGTVTQVDQGPGRVGDPVHGTMRIDTRLAPADAAFTYPEWVGEYSVNQECERNCLPERTEPSAFVTSPGIKDLGGAVYDNVLVIDKALDPVHEWDFDEYSVRDYEIATNFRGASQLRIDVASAVDFIMGESLVQSFDLQPAESGGSAGGVFESFLDGVASSFSFAIDRIRATPRVCRA